MSDEKDSKVLGNSTSKYQEEPFNQRLKDEQRSWDEGFSKVQNKDSPEGYSYPETQASPDTFPDICPLVKGTDAPPEREGESVDTSRSDGSLRYQNETNQKEMDAQRAWEERQSSKGVDTAPEVFRDPTEIMDPLKRNEGNTVESGSDPQEPRSTEDAAFSVRGTPYDETGKGRFQDENNQILTDAQKAWEEKQAAGSRDAAPGVFRDPADAYPSFEETTDLESSDGHLKNIRSTSDAFGVNSTIDVDSKTETSLTSDGTPVVRDSTVGGNVDPSSTGTIIIFLNPGGNSPGLGRMALRSVERGGKRLVTSAVPTNQMKQTHMGSGTATVYNTVGRYVMIPGVKAVYNRVSGVSTTLVSRVMLHHKKKNGYFESLYADPDFQNAVSRALRQKMGRNYVNIQQYESTAAKLNQKGYGTDIKRLNNILKKGSISDKDKALIDSYIKMAAKKKKLDKLVNPSGADNINSYYVIIKKSLRSQGMEPNAGNLKKALKKGSLSGVDKQLAEAFVGINSIQKLSEYHRLSAKAATRELKNGGTRLVRDFRRKLRQMMRRSENSTAVSLIFTYTMARRSLKVAYSVIKGPVKSTGTIVTRSIKQASQMTKSGSMMARSSMAAAPVIKKTYKHQMKSAIKGGTRLTRKVVGSVDRAGARLVQKGSMKAASMSSKAAANVVKTSSKAAAKVMVGTTKAVMFVVNLILSLVTSVIGALLPIIIIIVVVGVLIGGLLAIFSFDGGEMEDGTDSDTVVLVGQQYVDALDKCHEKFKEYLEQLSSDPSYETVTINYKDEKNEKVYKDWKNETGMVEGDNNIKECLCLMAVLFDFNMEEYVPSPLTDEIRQVDREKLYDFMEINDIDKSEYDGTYQNLIRSYLVGLFNGSHDVEKNVTVTYCGGCTSRKNTDGEDEYYCPGHRHLDVTVTTYYFDKLFNCALKATCGVDPLSSTLIGSNNIEKVWFGLINAGYTEEAASGVIGNLMLESGGGPNDIALNAVEGNGEGIGMVQWSYGRKKAFLQYCDQQGVGWPNEDITVQFNFMLSEMEGGQWMYTGYDYGYPKSTRMSLDEFKKLTDVEYATSAFCSNFERCSYAYSHIDRRLAYAKSVYASYHGRTQSAGGSTGETLQPGQKTVSLGNFKLTYYCGCYECNEGYNDAQGRPVGALGNPLTKNHSIAVDPSVIPYGSKILINGIVYTAEDCGGGVKGNHIDIYMGNDTNSHAETERLGVNYAEVFLVK